MEIGVTGKFCTITPQGVSGHRRKCSKPISETKKDQYIYIHHILNFELGDVTIVTDDEQIKAHKYVVRFANFFDTFLKQQKKNHQ